MGRKESNQTNKTESQYEACFGIDNLNMTTLSILHDLNIFHAMLSKTYLKPSSLKQIGQPPLVMVCQAPTL